jgi:hypothetical protein|tara:strand:- start:126 stop:647 length:522 start_codon:yes stop_codon:yes gene_type:complete
MCNFKLINKINTVDDYRNFAEHINNCPECGMRWLDDIEVSVDLYELCMLPSDCDFNMHYFYMKDTSTLIRPREFVVMRKRVNTLEVEDVFYINTLGEAISIMHKVRSPFLEEKLRIIKDEVWEQVVKLHEMSMELHKKWMKSGMTLGQKMTEKHQSEYYNMIEEFRTSPINIR